MNNPYDIIISNNDNATSFVELNDQYNALYNLLINNQRQISYLDLYKITEYINTEAEGVQIGSKFAQLNPNTAIGIGVPSIKFNGVEFYQGDLLLKLSNGQMQKLDAPSHGIYFPSIEERTKEDGSKAKSIIWNYSKDEPEKGSISGLENNDSAKWSLYWDIPNINAPNGYGQKILREGTENEFWETRITHLEGLVPIIKCFNDSNEEILADITVELPESGTEYNVSNIPSCVSYLMIR